MMNSVQIANDIAGHLVQIEGVRAVVLGGSWARGAGDANSDVDLGIYYDPATPLDIAGLRALAAELDDSHSGDVVTEIGGWGPWINGGAWLTVNGQRVDWIYRDLALVRQIIEACAAGNPKIYYQAGHPHGFHTPHLSCRNRVVPNASRSLRRCGGAKGVGNPLPTCTETRAHWHFMGSWLRAGYESQVRRARRRLPRRRRLVSLCGSAGAGAVCAQRAVLDE